MATQTSSKAGRARPSGPKSSDPARAVVNDKHVYDDEDWRISWGELKSSAPPRPGRKAAKVERLFRVVGEKLPFACLTAVRDHLEERLGKLNGVYIAHDSMGCPRYIGRGQIFVRLAIRKNAQKLELEYFSFYVVEDKKHEREVETLLIRAAGFLLEFNAKKKQVGHLPGNIGDYEMGTEFYARSYKNP